MGRVTIGFLGVCTIFKDLPSQKPPGLDLPPDTELPANRVILVRSLLEGIRPHIAKLQFGPEHTVIDGPPLEKDPKHANTYLLDGVGLSIANPSPQPLTGLTACLPSLQSHLAVPLGPPADFVFLPDPERAQAWFDVPSGFWTAYLMNPCPPCPEVPSISVLELETAGPPVLLYQRWGGATTSVTFDGDFRFHIAVMNFTDGTAFDKDNNDFRLNYLTAANFTTAWIPDIAIPLVNVCTQPSPYTLCLKGCGDAGPGCSNTGFP